MHLKTLVKMRCPNRGWTVPGVPADEMVPAGTEVEISDAKEAQMLITNGFMEEIEAPKKPASRRR